MSSDSLINKYRPDALSLVYGHREVTKSLSHSLLTGNAHCYIFVGPVGTGKTSLSRIVASHYKAQITEYNAADKTGKDDAEELLRGFMYRPIDGRNQCYIMNEVHGLSKKAFDSLLVILEEPPPWLYFCLTTTEGGKIPATVKSRGIEYQLKPISNDTLIELLEAIRDAEGITCPDDVIGVCARAAGGSARQAISNLAKCAGIDDRREAARLLEEADNPSDAIELARAIVGGKGWDVICPILNKLNETNPETIRHVCRAYITKVILDVKDQKKLPFYLEMLEAFSRPFNSSDQLSPVILAIGEILFAPPPF